MIQINSTVMTKKTGCVGAARVVGFVLPEFAINLSHNLNRWDELFPEWRQDLVAIIRHNKPQRPVSLEEYLNALPAHVLESIPNNEKEMHYQNNVPIVRFHSVPMCDLEELG